jgi:hypothetical protein
VNITVEFCELCYNEKGVVKIKEGGAGDGIVYL